jgi:hypothetical protein
MFPDFPALKDFLTFRETALDPFAVTVAFEATLCRGRKPGIELWIVPESYLGRSADLRSDDS